MVQTTRPYRSVLYMPGSNARALDKAKTLAADALIFDLEDAVAPDAKAQGRALLAEVLSQDDYGGRARILRINGLDGEWGRDDVAALGHLGADAVLLPKTGCAADLDVLAAMVPNADLWAMMETPAGIMKADEIAGHPRLKGMVLGTNDLTSDLGARFRGDRQQVLASLQLCLLAARAHGVICIDGVYNAFRDDKGLRAECEQGRDLGFDGKTLIHPAQLAVTNDVFGPSAGDVDLARRQIEAFEAAEASGKGVAVVDGKIVENLHVATAKATLTMAEAIAKLEDVA